MADEKRKWRTPKQWYEEEYRPASTWTSPQVNRAVVALAILLLCSPFLIRQAMVDTWAWPTWRDVLISLPLMLIGIAILLRYRALTVNLEDEEEPVWHDEDIDEPSSAPGTQWYDQESRAKTLGDLAYRAADSGVAIILLGSSFLIRFMTLERWAWPTARDVLISIPFVLVGLALLLWQRTPSFKRRQAREHGWHEGQNKQLSSMGAIRHQAACRCGWEGPVRGSEEDALLDRVDHMLREDRIRQAAKRKPRT